MVTSTFNYNQDYETRERMIFGAVNDYSGRREHDINDFYSLSLKTLKELLRLNFAAPEQCENTGMTISEVLELCSEWSEQYPGLAVKLGGYTVSPKRKDYRVSINRIEVALGFEGEREFLLELLNFIGDYEVDEIIATTSSVSFSWDWIKPIDLYEDRSAFHFITSQEGYRPINDDHHLSWLCL